VNIKHYAYFRYVSMMAFGYLKLTSGMVFMRYDYR